MKKPDSIACYEFGIAALREIAVRSRNVRPEADRPDEARWAVEGMPKLPDGRPDYRQLETVRRG